MRHKFTIQPFAVCRLPLAARARHMKIIVSLFKTTRNNAEQIEENPAHSALLAEAPRRMPNSFKENTPVVRLHVASSPLGSRRIHAIVLIRRCVFFRREI
jgi:hypothetical protein